MNRADFYQAKMTFLMQFPDVDELAFYRYYTQHNPQEAIGWLHLGREWEKRGQTDKALEAYRKAAVSKQSDKSADEAREDYHRLLRSKKRQSRLSFARRGVAALFFLMTLFYHLLVPHQATQEPDTQFPRQSAPAYVHTEVIAIPASMSETDAKKQLLNFLSKRHFTYNKPYNLAIITEAEGLPLFTPLVFYSPAKLRGVISYDPATNQITKEKWYQATCNCGNDPLVLTTKQAIGREQTELATVLTLRNALFTRYQQSGKLPMLLSDLDQPYPHNVLSTIPAVRVAKDDRRTPKKNTDANSTVNQNWPYQPAAFRQNDAWNSMRQVVQLIHYPEPSAPLEPLSIYVQQSSYRLTLMSGSHIVRRYPIGIGQEQSTPVGYFRILQKINQPEGHDHIFGTRGLLFANSDYAIHGTNKPDSIGHSESLGCIRLHNSDVEELYSFVSPGTEVIISAKQAPPLAWSNSPRFLLPVGKDEETPQVVYHWLH